ncbi:histone-lysine N-methyltransferase EHMT2 isoform X2 [Trichoplusia ni]|uniref:Histone-lysine N-methyltransferase EHMT2 isoform X2 n=1 Tax=Trichoplusia ni TaxID=7111 RepID=A0A7E5VKX1_TRINI|nr:histone-lysine N-methyltransferase EHMT2 isoform X2 [Trichoplusia ni]
MNADEDVPTKKKVDKPPTENLTVTVDKIDAKRTEKGDEEPKPRIVLTFRSEKTNAKNSNMKIVTPEEKQEEAPRRSSRTRGKWEWICDSDTSPKKDKSGAQTTSENDESDSSHTTPKRSTRRRSKDSDNVLANAIARKEKSYEQAVPQRFSRRIKPTAKFLANDELRIGLESQNNARLGIQSEKSPEEGVRTRRTARPLATEVEKKKEPEVEEEIVDILGTDDDSQSQNTVMKLKHLCELGLKAINPEDVDDENREEEEGEAEEIDEDDEMDDDPVVISKLLETDEDSSEDFQCTVATSTAKNRPRRSTRLCSSFGMNDSDRSSPPVGDDDNKTHRKRRRRRSSIGNEAQSDVEMEETSAPAGGDEGSEAACPADESTVVATCFCEASSNVYAAPKELTEPVFCQAIELVDGFRVGCSHPARHSRRAPPPAPLAPLLRAGPRAPYFLACALHAAQLAKHMCCPACGLFCTQGTFYQCSLGHLFHLECGLPYNDAKLRPGCPHCGVYSYRWLPANTDCVKVKVEMKCSNKRIFLPDQREHCTPAYLSFSSRDVKPESGPIIPEELLPSPPIDLKQLCQKTQHAPSKSAQQLCDAILRGETVEQLIPKIVSAASLNKPLASQAGGTCAHAAARGGRAGALCLLHYAGAQLERVDHNMRTPLAVAVLALLDKPEKKNKEKSTEASNDETEGEDKEIEKPEEEVSSDKEDDDVSKAKDEDLIKVIRYLVAAGCDVNFPGPDGMTALHIAAQHGSVRVVSLLLPHAQVDARDHGGWTPLVWAAENDHAEVVRVLLSHGADPLSCDNEGNGAVHWCALGGAARALRELLAARPHAAAATNTHADTPLHVAARQGHYACVVILLARGARTDVENSAGELPVEVCSGQCQSAISLNMQMGIAMRENGPRYRLLSSDISRGREPFPVPCENDVDDAPLPDDFTYVTRHVTPQQISVDCTIDTMQGCDCKDGDCTSGSCACTALGVRCWYSRGRLLPSFPYHDPPMLFECNQTCGCNLRTCGNSVISRGSAGGSLLARAARRARGALLRGAAAAAARRHPRQGPLHVRARRQARPSRAMLRQDRAMRGRGAVRQRGAVHQPQLPAQPGARARVHGHARPAPAHRRALRHHRYHA